jgi:FixJ family two-component response regulator
MKTSKLVTVVHPDSRTRGALRSTLEAHGCTVATDCSCADLLSEAGARPNLILLDRALASTAGCDLLSRLSKKWDEAEIVFLPEGLTAGAGRTVVPPELLRIVDRLLQMRTTRELLAT